MINIIIKLELMPASIPVNTPYPGLSTPFVTSSIVNMKCIIPIQIMKSNA